MDINENEDQMQELEPLSSDPQPAPEPEEAEPVEELVQEDEPSAVEQTPEVQDESEDQVAEEPLEFLDDLPAMEPEEEMEAEEPEKVEADSEEDTAEAEAELEPEEDSGVPADDPLEANAPTPAEETAGQVPTPIPDKYILKTDEDEKEEEEIIPYHHDPDAVDGRAWYVIHCYSGNEDKVRHNILQRIESMTMDDLIFDVVVPTEDEVNIKNGERQTVEKKVFPGYILVYMVLTEESWYMVRNTPGVTGFVGMGNDPTPLQPEEVARILKRMESESPRINVTFRAGERVRIVDGPFEDFYGKVSEIDMERATVRVMVNFFGRETPVELDFLQVEEA